MTTPQDEIPAHAIEVDWEAARRAGLLQMVAEEPGTIRAGGHRLVTCGAHTGFFVKAIALCDDADWAAAIAEALATLTRKEKYDG